MASRRLGKLLDDKFICRRIRAGWLNGVTLDDIAVPLGIPASTARSIVEALGLPKRDLRPPRTRHERSREEMLDEGRRRGGDIVRRRIVRQPDPIRLRHGPSTGFPIKHLDAETRALIDAALAAQPRAGRRAPV